MSENTNRIFWLSAIGIVVTAVVVLFYNTVAEPTGTLYDNNNNISLCASSNRVDSLICLDASNNSKLGSHINNREDNKDIWYSQESLEESSEKYANLNNFDFNDDSGWLPYALKFDGINDNTNLNLKDVDFKDGMTIQVNVKPLEANKEMTLISNGNIDLRIKNNKIVYTLKTTDGTYEINYDKDLSVNTWYLIDITYNNDRMKLYVNGILVENKEISGTIVTSSSDFIVGNNMNAELSSIIVYKKDIEENGINQNAVAIYEKIYSIDKYRESFNATDSCQEWIVPMTGEYQVELWGAQGAKIGSDASGGKGAYTTGDMVLTKGDKYYICVGKQGTVNGNVANGGNSTDVRLSYNGDTEEFSSLKSRIMIAAAGGGGNNAKGGAGGMTIGLTSKTQINNVKNAQGGTQTSGGIKATNVSTETDALTMSHTNGTSGDFGIKSTAPNGATGGNGYFSGGAISNKGGAAGGSSYISGGIGSNSLIEESTKEKMVFTGGVKHYSGKMFYSAKMISGEGRMPSDSDVDETMVGKVGDGSARITFISTELANSDPEIPTDGNLSTSYVGEPKKSELKGSEVGSTTATFVYGKAEGATGYACYFGDTPEETDKLTTVLISPTGDRQCNLTYLDENTTYYVKMVTLNSYGKTESELTEFKTDYKEPTTPSLITTTVETNTITAEYFSSENATSYKCLLGTDKFNLDIEGTVEVQGDKTVCKKEGLEQNTTYWIRLDAINGTKTTPSVLVSALTKFANPALPTLKETVTSYTSITNTYNPSRFASTYKCHYGTSEDKLDEEADFTIDSDGNPVCTIAGLTQGVEYFTKITAINGHLTTESEILKIRTDYKEPGKTEELERTVTNNSITTNFQEVDLGQEYKCYYGTSEDSLTNEGTVISLPSGDKQCNMTNLDQNTTYYYQYAVTNGDKEVRSDIYDAKTEYNEATIGTFLTGSQHNANIYEDYQVTTKDEEYVCELTTDKTSTSYIVSPTIEGNVAHCEFKDVVADTTYYARLKSVNGDKNIATEYNTYVIDAILPYVSATIPDTTMNENNWAKEDFDVTLHVGSEDPNSIYGVAWCTDTKECTPTYTFENENYENDEGEVIGEHEVMKFGAANNNGAFTVGGEFTADVRITTESPTNYVCATPFTRTKKPGQTKCFGPYALDKTKPEIVYNDITSIQFTEVGMYTDFTISDNLTAVADLVKNYNTVPDWNTPNTYPVTYTVTDLAGNTKEITRDFIVKWYEVLFSVKPIINGTKQSAGKAGFTYDLTINHETGDVNKTNIYSYSENVKYGSEISMTAHEKTGYTLTDKELSTTSRLTDIEFNPKWQTIDYNITYDLDGGTGVSNRTYTVEDNFTLPTPTKTGYDFLGWTGSNGDTADKTVKIENTTGDKFYTANWKLKSYTVDVNPVINGTTHNSGANGYTFSVWVDNVRVATNVKDWSATLNHFQKVRVKANGRSGYNITANGDQTKTISGTTYFSPTWLDNIAPTIGNCWADSFSTNSSGSKNFWFRCNVSDAGVGVGNVCYIMDNIGGNCWPYSQRNGEDFYKIAAGKTRWWTITAYDNRNNSSSARKSAYIG